MKILLAVLLGIVLLQAVCAVPMRKGGFHDRSSRPADIWTNCGPNDHLTVGTVVVTPDPPLIGQNLTIKATGSLDETVTSGTVYIQLAYSSIDLVNNTFNLCTLAPSFGLQCPIPQGPVAFTVSQLIPSQAIPGPYTGVVKVHDQNGSEVACIALSFTLSPTGSPAKIQRSVLKKMKTGAN